ncbi:hypothetical protein EV648_12536 [Kribbella sp. VKM Ac-2568]|nr:hypothetical protein EV648_12536 [Kribbella sp. VKM Ac-2568]
MWSEFAVKEVALSIAANGFWTYEPLVVAQEGGRLIVVEGNRRLAAVKLLTDPSHRKRVGATDLPTIGDARLAELRTLPVIISTRADAWQFIGFKHVNGPQQWQSYSKAQYIAWVHNELRIPLDEIAETIGDTHQTTLRLYRALMTLDQAERNGVWSREDRYKAHFSFSHLFVGLNSYSGIQSHIGLSGPPADTRDPVPEERLPELGELMLWMFGSKKDEIPPLVASQNPNLRQLDQVLGNRNAVSAIRQGLPLGVALDVAKGDSAKLREDLVAARRLLQDSRGKVLTGFVGERDLLELANEILTLSESIVDDMNAYLKRQRRSKRLAN